MSILVAENVEVIVQGLTGRTGTFHTEQVQACAGTGHGKASGRIRQPQV